MAQPCLSCTHPRRGAIDRDLARSEPLSAISSRFGVSVGSLRRHQQNHVTQGRSAGRRRVTVRGPRAVEQLPEFVEVGVTSAMSSGSEVEIELRCGRTDTTLRLRGRLEPAALQILARTVINERGGAV